MVHNSVGFLHTYYIHTTLHYTMVYRGLSSTVRRCVHKDNGKEYAVKIVDRSQEDSITESIAIEMQILRTLPHHKHISELIYMVPRFIGGHALVTLYAGIHERS